MHPSNLIIRPASIRDLDSILRLVRELAAYEREPDAVTASLEDYHRDFANGWFLALIAESAGDIVGTAIFHPAYSTWKGRMIWLEDLIVTEPFRGLGIGRLLFEAVSAEAKARGARLLKWQVLRWNAPAIGFYDRFTTEWDDGWQNGRIRLERMDG